MGDVRPESEPYMDLVQIRTNGSFGSGLLVGPGLVLTARHCVADRARGWRPWDDIQVSLWRELAGAGMVARERQIAAKIEWPRLPRETGPEDLAVLVLKEKPAPFTQWLHRSPRASSEKAEARGFPAAASGEGLPGGRIERNLAGSALNANVTERTIGFTVESGLDALTKERWNGLSGGPLIAGGELIGVMRNVAKNLDKNRVLEAEMLALALARNERLRDVLKLSEPPPPHPELSALFDLLYTLDRREEVERALESVDEHEGQCSVELLVSGQPEDLCQHFWKRLWLQRLGRASKAPRSARAGNRLLPGQPPLPLDWPITGGSPGMAARRLARAALSMLVQSDGTLPPGLRDPLRGVLEKASSPPWLCLILPNAPTKFDRALLEEWRGVWAGLKLPPRVSAGYMLLYSGPLPRPAFYDFKASSVKGLGHAEIQLRSVSRDQVLEWQFDLEKYWEAGGRKGPRLDKLAIDLHGQIEDRTQLRMADVQALVQGHKPRLAA